MTPLVQSCSGWTPAGLAGPPRGRRCLRHWAASTSPGGPARERPSARPGTVGRV